MKNQDVYPQIAAACVAAGTPAEVVNGRLTIRGQDMCWYISVKLQAARDLYLSARQEAGRVKKYYITVGSIGEQKVYRQKSDGSFSYDKLAEHLSGIAEKRNREATRCSIKERNEPIADAVSTRLGLSRYSGALTVQPSDYREDLPLRLKVEVSVSADAARAEEIYHGLVALGLIAPRAA